MHNDDLINEVGYGRPPISGQFKKGQSGNPKGRPKGSKNLACIVLREARKPVRVSGPDGSCTVTKLEAAVMQVQNKAAQGDLRSQREFFSLVQRAEELENSTTSPQHLNEADHQVMQSLLLRIKGTPMALASQAKNDGDQK